jgi:peptidoglycan/xylan/chitin deacetylase (PgdA/CDA1 family)
MQVVGLTQRQAVEYDRLRAKGQSHNMALIFATRQAPAMDRTDERLRAADDRREHGKRAPRGRYQSGLARFPGDPKAFVKSRGEARQRANAIGREIINPADIYNDLDRPEFNGEWEDEHDTELGIL